MSHPDASPSHHSDDLKMAEALLRELGIDPARVAAARAIRNLLFEEARHIEVGERQGVPAAFNENLFPILQAMQPDLVPTGEGRAEKSLNALKAEPQPPTLTLVDALNWLVTKDIDPDVHPQLSRVPMLELLGVRLDLIFDSRDNWGRRATKLKGVFEALKESPSIGFLTRSGKAPDEQEQRNLLEVLEAAQALSIDQIKMLIIGMAAQPELMEKDLGILKLSREKE